MKNASKDSSENSFAIIARVKAESVKKHTGKDWKTWIGLLDKAGARNWEHKQIVAYLVSKYGLSPWWRQGVATGFETYLGKKVEGRNAKGFYMLTVTKSLAINQKKAWNLMVSEEGQALWLQPLEPVKVKAKKTFEVSGGIFGEVRTFKAPERLRISWQESEWLKKSFVQLWVIKRPGEKCMIVFTHEGLPSARDRIQYRNFWKAAVERISDHLANAK